MPKLNDEIEKTIIKVKEANDVLNMINYLNFNKLELIGFDINIISRFAQRECSFLSSVIALFEYEYKRKLNKKQTLDYRYVDDRLIIFFLIRDIIENIEIIFYMLLNSDDFIDEKYNFTDEYEERLNMLRGKSKTKGLRIYKKEDNKKSKLEISLYNKYNENILEKDFYRIKEIKIKCNDIIHKNGYSNIYPNYDLFYKYMNIIFKDLLFVCKFNFKLLFLLQGHILMSSDYIDAQDIGVTPEINSQYLIAAVFVDYIKNQFSEEEKQWLKLHNDCDCGMNMENI